MRVLSCHLGLPHALCSALMEATKRTLPPISQADKRHEGVHPPSGPLDTCANRRQPRAIAPFVWPRTKGPCRPSPGSRRVPHPHPARTLPGGI